MDFVDQIPVGIGHLGEALVAQDAGVVDDDVDATEVVHRALNDTVTVDDVVRVGDGGTASGFDLFDNLERGFAVGAFAVGAATEVVDDDFGAVFREQQGVGAANTAASTGYDDDFVVKTDIAHGLSPWFVRVEKGSQCRTVV